MTMKSAKILTIALASVLLLASCQTTSEDPSPSTGDSTTSETPTPSTSTSDSTSPSVFSSWTDAFDTVVNEVTSGAETVASLEADYDFTMPVAQIAAYVPYFDAPFEDSWTGFITFTSSYYFEDNDRAWGISCGSFNRFTIEDAFTSLEDELASVLTGLDNWSQTANGDWRTTLEDGTTYCVMVGYSEDSQGLNELCLVFDKYANPTSWESYLNRYASYETAYEFVITIEQINKYVPFIAPSVYEFSDVSPIYANEDGSLLMWTVCGKSGTSVEAIQDELTKIQAAIASVCTTEAGWSTSTTSTGTTWYYQDFGEITPYVSATYLYNNDGTEFTPCIVFDGITPATSWSEYVDTSYESRYTFALTAAQVDEYVPFFQYDFDTYIYTESQFTAKYGVEYNVWALGVETSSSQAALDLAKLNVALRTYLTTDLGWTEEGSGTDIAFYKPVENLGTLYVYATSTYLYDSQGAQYPYVLLVFDVELASIEITSWADYLAGLYSYYESQYKFAATASNINSYIPFWESEYASGVYLGESLFTANYSVWGVGVNNLADAEAQTAAVNGIAAELATALGSNTAWTAVDVVVSDTYTAKGYSRVVNENLTIYVYAAPATRTTDSSGNTLATPVYGAYLIFDAAVVIPDPTAWGEISNDLGVTIENFVYYYETRYSVISSGMFNVIQTNVPYVAYDWTGLSVINIGSSTSAYYAYLVYVTTTAAEYETELAAVTTALSEKLLDAGFTYDEAESEFRLPLTSTYGIAVWVTGNSSGTEIYVIFYLYNITSTAS